MKVSIVIPALNEERSIGRVLDQIPLARLPQTEVIVVDNGSTDRTAQVALSRGARVVSEPRRGYGVATMSGVSKASGDVIVTMDADGAHSPTDLPELIDPVIKGYSMATVGVRIHSFPHGMKIRRFLGNVLLARVFDALYRERLSDVQCGFRAISRKVFDKITLSEIGMQFTTELLLEMKEKRVPFLPVQVTQAGTEKSHLREVQDFLGNLILMLRRFPTFLSTRDSS